MKGGGSYRVVEYVVPAGLPRYQPRHTGWAVGAFIAIVAVAAIGAVTISLAVAPAERPAAICGSAPSNPPQSNTPAVTINPLRLPGQPGIGWFQFN